MRKRVKRVYDENGNVTHKVCGKCGELKSIDEFNVRKDASDGHRNRCKECKKKHQECKKKYDVTHKVCSKCGELKSIDEFNVSKRASDGYQHRCRECMKKYWKENKERNKERNKKYNKKYNEENKEQIKERKKKYYEELCDEAITRIKTIVEQDPTRYDYKVGEEIYGVIYLVHCKPTNKYYVGQTTVGFDNRYSKGFFNDKGHRTKDNLKEDLERYGEDSFEITKIFKVAHSKEELDDLEVYYIDYFNSYYDGYNETRGNHHTK